MAAARPERVMHLAGDDALTPDYGSGSIFFVGTATVLIRYAGFTILTDPNFLHAGDHVHLGYGLTAKRLTDPGLDVDQLPALDCCVLSHLSSDHFDRIAEACLDRDLPIPKMETMERVLSENVAQRRLNMLLLGLFALVALILAAVGIYGVMSYAVTQRTNEIGIRVALGAQTLDVLRLVVVQGMKLALAGVAIGLVATLALTRLMTSLLFGLSPRDPWTFAATAGLLLLVAALSCFLPARRAAKAAPMVSLRTE